MVGVTGNEGDVTKTVNVDLLDTMRFGFSSKPEISEGDVVRFVITNKGKIPHEFSIGNQQEQDAHREAMRKTPDMKHEDGNSVTVDPGKTKQLIWSFTSESRVVFACNIPGHYEAGMFSKVHVQSVKTKHNNVDKD